MIEKIKFQQILYMIYHFVFFTARDYGQLFIQKEKLGFY